MLLILNGIYEFSKLPSSTGMNANSVFLQSHKFLINIFLSGASSEILGLCEVFLIMLPPLRGEAW